MMKISVKIYILYAVRVSAYNTKIIERLIKIQFDNASEIFSHGCITEYNVAVVDGRQADASGKK